MRRHVRPPVLLSYVTFVFIGINAGVNGVLLPAQMAGYGVDRATIGITFFTGSAGFVLAGLCTGALVNRFGVRIALVTGGGAYVLAGLYLATRPPFGAFVLVLLVVGFAIGILESVLNVYLTSLPDATALLNRLHAFFGVGALSGPVLAAWILGFASWTTVWLVMAVACVPLVTGFLAAYPRPQRGDPPPEAPEAPGVSGATATHRASDAGAAAAAPAGGLLRGALRERGVLFGAAMLAVYVGLELGVGGWGFSYLVQARALPESFAGYSVSGYWLGLTLGRFLISPVASRMGASVATMMYACLAGVTAAAMLAWLSPAAVVASVALVLLGFFLGPVFPTTMAIAPQLTRASLVPTAIGVMNAASVVGGAALPWLVGAIAQGAGMWVLLPFTVTLAVLQFATWWPLANRIRTPVSPP
ncbi:MAG: MFS transporter [Streptosporangiaceae bacterium]|nr:MFS transporter [Streptosporangiaceae bacterium]MBV9857774.1 MFS transporter [Streptosporangiaceae bacterium]